MSDYSQGNDIEALEPTDDREFLGFLRGRGFTIGFVDEVNGPGSVERPDYQTSRHELEVLTKHWLERQLSSQTRCWLDAQVGSNDIRLQHYAGRRRGRIAAILGDDRIGSLVQEVEEEYRQKLGDECWEAFQRDDTDWRDRELDRCYAEMDRKRETNKSPS